jgi:hypothetical protein
MNLASSPLIAIGVLASTTTTDAAFVFFTAAVASARRRVAAANWSTYLLSAFAVIGYTENPLYVTFAAASLWPGAFVSMTWLHRDREPVTPRHDPP